jgi:hypothetical protein
VAKQKTTSLSSDVRDTSILGVVTWIIYAVTATVTATVGPKGLVFSNDTFFSAYPAWTIAQLQTINIDTVTQFTSSGWAFILDGNLRSDRFPGAILWAVPFYLIGGGDTFSIGPSAIAAATASAITIVFMHRALLSLVNRKTALAAAVLLAFGTAMWSVSADSLWTHPTTLMGLAIGSWAMTRSHFAIAGLGYAVAILSRPHTAVVAAAVGIWESTTRKSIRPALLVGATSLLGLIGLVAWNKVNANSWDIFPGTYGGRFDAAISAGDGGQAKPNLWSADLAATFFSPLRGIFIYSPFLLALLPGVIKAWRVAPAWVRSSTVGAGLYLLVQLAGNVWIGATGFFGYRLTLEPLLLVTPLLALAWQEWTSQITIARRAFGALAAISLWWFAVASITRSPDLNGLLQELPWTQWQVPLAIQAQQPAVWLGATVFVAAVGYLVWPMTNPPVAAKPESKTKKGKKN